MVQGRTLVTVTFSKVHWQWLSLPVLVWVLGFVSWAGTMVISRRAGLETWNNDPLPFLYLYREDRRDDKVVAQGEGVPRRNSPFYRRAERVVVRLLRDSDGTKLQVL